MKPWTIGKFMDMFHDLEVQIPWERRDDAPRSEAWMMKDDLRPYTYGRGKGERTYQPHHYPPLVHRIAESVGQMLNTTMPNGGFANLYRNQRDHLGWHSDDDPNIDHSQPIVSVSFGAERRIQFRPKPPEGVPRNLWLEHDYTETIEELTMKSGSVTVMPAGCQFNLQHRIPKGGEEMGPRISLTYRWIRASGA